MRHETSVRASTDGVVAEGAVASAAEWTDHTGVGGVVFGDGTIGRGAGASEEGRARGTGRGMSRAIRVSEAAYLRLVAMAKSENRTVIAAVDRLVGVTAGMVESEQRGSVVATETSRLETRPPAGEKTSPAEPDEVIQQQLKATAAFLARQRVKQQASNARQWRGREGEDDQRPPEEQEE